MGQEDIAQKGQKIKPLQRSVQRIMLVSHLFMLDHKQKPYVQ